MGKYIDRDLYEHLGFMARYRRHAAGHLGNPVEASQAAGEAEALEAAVEALEDRVRDGSGLTPSRQ